MGREIGYRLKIFLRDKPLIFWTLLFPMILATFFNVSLRNAYDESEMKPISLAIVESHNEQNNLFIEQLEQRDIVVSKPYATREEAELAMENKDVSAYVVNKQGIVQLVLGQELSNMESSLLTQIVHSYNTKKQLIEAQTQNNQGVVSFEFIEEISQEHKFVDVDVAEKKQSLVLINFYSTIAMLCIYASEWGNKSGKYLQANLSPLGIRTNISPTRKGKLILFDIVAVYLVFLMEYTIHLSYLKFVLDVPFGNFDVIAITGMLGGLLSVTFGYTICVMVNASEDLRGTIISMMGLFMSFLSGMMSAEIKYNIDTHFPLVNKLNPAALITDNLYRSYALDDPNLIYMNYCWMIGIILVLGYLSYRKLRVVTYDHL